MTTEGSRVGLSFCALLIPANTTPVLATAFSNRQCTNQYKEVLVLGTADTGRPSFKHHWSCDDPAHVSNPFRPRIRTIPTGDDSGTNSSLLTPLPSFHTERRVSYRPAGVDGVIHQRQKASPLRSQATRHRQYKSQSWELWFPFTTIVPNKFPPHFRVCCTSHSEILNSAFRFICFQVRYSVLAEVKLGWTNDVSGAIRVVVRQHICGCVVVRLGLKRAPAVDCDIISFTDFVKLVQTAMFVIRKPSCLSSETAHVLLVLTRRGLSSPQKTTDFDRSIFIAKVGGRRLWDKLAGSSHTIQSSTRIVCQIEET